jgi:hypothetical protein
LLDSPSRHTRVHASGDHFRDTSILPDFPLPISFGGQSVLDLIYESEEFSLILIGESRGANKWRSLVDGRRTLILTQTRSEDWISFKDESLRLPDGNIDDRPLKQLPGVSNIDPTEAIQPSPTMEPFQESFRIKTIREQDKDMPAAPLLFASHFVRDSSTGRAPGDVCRP